MSETHIRIARFSVNIPSERSLSFVEAKILGKLQVFECVSLSLSLSSWVSKCGEFLELALSQQDKGNGLVDMHTGIQYLRGIFRSSSFARHAYLICRYEYETWCFSMHVYIYIYTRMFTDSIVKEEEKERGEKKKSIRQRRERENNGVNEPWTTSTRNSRNGRSTAVFGIPLRIWRVQKYQGHFCPRRNESEAYVNLYAYVLSMRKLNRVNQGREELESIEFLEFDFV